MRGPRQANAQPRQREHAQEHALSHSSIGIKFVGRSQPIQNKWSHKQDAQRPILSKLRSGFLAREKKNDSRHKQDSRHLTNLRLSQSEAKDSERTAIQVGHDVVRTFMKIRSGKILLREQRLIQDADQAPEVRLV